MNPSQPPKEDMTTPLASVELPSSSTIDLSSFFEDATQKVVPKEIPADKNIELKPIDISTEPLQSAMPSGITPPSQTQQPPSPGPVLSESSGVSTGAKRTDQPQQDGLLSIGKLLVDQNTLEQIIKTAEKGGGGGLTTTKIISAIKGQSLDILLSDINRISGVMGSLIVGKDGLVIANTMPGDIDKDLVGALTSSIFSNVDIQTKRMQRGLLKRMVLDTNMGLAVLAEVEMGTLVVFSKPQEKFDINNVLSAVGALTGKA